MAGTPILFDVVQTQLDIPIVFVGIGSLPVTLDGLMLESYFGETKLALECGSNLVQASSQSVAGQDGGPADASPSESTLVLPEDAEKGHRRTQSGGVTPQASSPPGPNPIPQPPVERTSSAPSELLSALAADGAETSAAASPAASPPPPLPKPIRTRLAASPAPALGPTATADVSLAATSFESGSGQVKSDQVRVLSTRQEQF